MYYELYIDVLFLVNFLMDYILLLVTKKVLKAPVSHGRICLGALTGSLLSCLVTAVRIPYTSVKIILFYTLIPAVMLLAGIKIRDIRSFFRGIIMLYISGFLVGGVFEYLNQYVQVGSLFFALAVASYYISSGVLKVLALLFRFGETHCQVTLYSGESSCEAAAIIDTGNHLTDQVSGKAVSIISSRVAEELSVCRQPEKMRYIPYQTIGEDGGVLPIFSIDRMCIAGKKEQWIEQPVVAVSKDASFGNEYDVILNPDI